MYKNTNSNDERKDVEKIMHYLFDFWNIIIKFDLSHFSVYGCEEKNPKDQIYDFLARFSNQISKLDFNFRWL